MIKCGVLCPGPSLGLYQTQKQISLSELDCLIAVNGAILLSDFKIDYWVMQDIEVFESIIEKDIAQFYTTRLWIPNRWLSDIPENYNKLNYHFQAFYKKTFPSGTEEFIRFIAEHNLPFAKDIPWRDSTMFMAILLAIISGAKQIHIYGADLCGKGYFVNGLDNYRQRHDEKRWTEERFWLRQIIDRCLLYDINIINHGDDNRA